MSDRLNRLGSTVAQAQDEILAERDDLHRVRARLLAKGPAPRARWPWAAGAITLAAAAAFLAFMMWPQPESTLVYRVAGERDESPAGRWLSAPPDATRRLSFSDGSDVDLHPSTDLRVTRLDSDGAGVQLERGRASLSVRHRAQTHWSVDAGPFRVNVVGTRFDIDWEPDSATLVLEMREGEVELVGPVVHHRRVRAGERVQVSLRDLRELTVMEEQHAEAVPQPAVTPEPLPIATRAPRPAPRVATYEELARDGRYEEAVAAAERGGWDQTLRSASAPSLLLLGDASRFSRQTDRAAQVYERVRARFGSSAHAARAAFALGRLAQDQSHDAPDAVRWFETYLREAPGGSLAREASGRLIEARRSAGDRAGAQRAAQEYLEAYPEGPHAPLAHSLVH